jgi:hypothetical protein
MCPVEKLPTTFRAPLPTPPPYLLSLSYCVVDCANYTSRPDLLEFLYEQLALPFTTEQIVELDIWVTLRLTQLCVPYSVLCDLVNAYVRQRVRERATRPEDLHVRGPEDVVLEFSAVTGTYLNRLPAEVGRRDVVIDLPQAELHLLRGRNALRAS